MHLISEKGRRYREQVARVVQMQRAQVRFTQLLAVDVALEMPDRKLRDVDNISKALFDALSYAGVWKDDSQIDQYRVRRVRDDSGGLQLYQVRNSAGKRIESGRITVRIVPIE